MSVTQLDADVRLKMGRQVKSLRREGFVPANIVCHGKESRAIQIEYNPLEKVLNSVGYTQPVELMVDKEKTIVLVTQVDIVPAKNTLSHVTFQEVRKGEKVTAEVPLRLVGEAPASQLGLMIIQTLDSVEVQAGALSIPEHFDVDISGLKEENDTVHISSLTVPEGVEILTEQEAGVVHAEAPRAVEEEPEPELEEGEEGAEGTESPKEGEPADGEADADSE